MIRLNVLIIIPNLGSGGAQRVFHQQRQYFSAHFNITGCVFNWDGAFEADHASDIVSLSVPAGHTLFHKIYYFLLRVIRLRKLKKKNKIDIAISHLEGADYVNLLSRKSDKVICWLHGTKKFDNNIEGWLGWVRKKIFIPILYRRSNRIICVSDGIRTELLHEYNFDPRTIETLVNGFDQTEILKKVEERNSFPVEEIADGAFTLITHCRLARQKNIDSLISIFLKIKRRIKTKLVILGDGELRDSLLVHAESIGLKSYAVWRNDALTNEYDIYFAGYQSNPYPALSEATVYMMTSLWEGFPLALGEAMICNVPTLAADCFTGPREILAPKLKAPQPIQVPLATPFGILMPLADSVGNIELWVDEVYRLLEDEPKRMRLADLAKRHMSEFDQTTIYKKWLQVIYAQTTDINN